MIKEELKVKILDIQDDPIKIKLVEPEDDKIVIPLKVRKNLNGTIFICDHPYVDIVVDPNKRKITTFSKTEYWPSSAR
jgi:formylmethanofuran dehydrogenase subunit D